MTSSCPGVHKWGWFYTPQPTQGTSGKAGNILGWNAAKNPTTHRTAPPPRTTQARVSVVLRQENWPCKVLSHSFHCHCHPARSLLRHDFPNCPHAWEFNTTMYCVSVSYCTPICVVHAKGVKRFSPPFPLPEPTFTPVEESWPSMGSTQSRECLCLQETWSQLRLLSKGICVVIDRIQFLKQSRLPRRESGGCGWNPWFPDMKVPSPHMGENFLF